MAYNQQKKDGASNFRIPRHLLTSALLAELDLIAVHFNNSFTAF